MILLLLKRMSRGELILWLAFFSWVAVLAPIALLARVFL